MTQDFPSDRHKQLDVLAGIWDTTITPLNPDGTATQSTKATDTYAWASNGHFLLHDVDADMDGKAIKSFEVISVSPDSGYDMRSYDADGSISDFMATLTDETGRSPDRFSASKDRSGRISSRCSGNGNSVTNSPANGRR